MLTILQQEALEMATICSECKWGIFYRQEPDDMIVRLEHPLCGHQSSLRGRNFVSGEFIFLECQDINREGNCHLHEPKDHPGAQNIISHDGVDFTGMPDEGQEEEDDDED